MGVGRVTVVDAVRGGGLSPGEILGLLTFEVIEVEIFRTEAGCRA